MLNSYRVKLDDGMLTSYRVKLDDDMLNSYRVKLDDQIRYCSTYKCQPRVGRFLGQYHFQELMRVQWKL